LAFCSPGWWHLRVSGRHRQVAVKPALPDQALMVSCTKGLPAIRLAQLDAGDLGHRIPLIGGLQRPGEQGILGDQLWRLPRIGRMPPTRAAATTTMSGLAICMKS